jgi:hypothetical protein
MTDSKPNDWKDVGKKTNRLAQYSGLAFQMLGTILVFTYGGYKLDQYLQNKIPVWTLVLSLTSIAASLYMFIRNLPKN